MRAHIHIPAGSTIFILEDSDERIRWFRQKLFGCRVVICCHAEEAIARLGVESFDYIFLDHDLSIINPERDNGETVARSLCDAGYLGQNVLIHSWNPRGAANMAKALTMATVCPFGQFDIEVKLNVNGNPPRTKEPLFWSPVPWRIQDGMIFDASGDAILEIMPNGKPYFRPDVAKAIVTAVNAKFRKEN